MCISFVGSDVEFIAVTPKEEREQTRKKVKTEVTKVSTKKSSQRARILQICDSSSDEEVTPAASNGKPNDSKPNVSADDAEMSVPKEKENTTPEKQNENEKDQTNGSVTDEAGPKKRRYKAKKMIKRTYEDADGYISKRYKYIHIN